MRTRALAIAAAIALAGCSQTPSAHPFSTMPCQGLTGPPSSVVLAHVSVSRSPSDPPAPSLANVTAWIKDRAGHLRSSPHDLDDDGCIAFGIEGTGEFAIDASTCTPNENGVVACCGWNANTGWFVPDAGVGRSFGLHLTFSCA
ncbi:MAG: hypothetical protein V4510_07600 [bacterium]